jgi:two-component sensor histidine kinase
MASPNTEALQRAPSLRRWTVVGPVELVGLRAQLRHLASLWALPEDCVDTLVMIVNELVCNAIDHARTMCEITVRRTKPLVRVLVTDGSTSPPRIPPHDITAPRGRGLQMVKALADRWGWSARHRGKTVWAVVNCSEA